MERPANHEGLPIYIVPSQNLVVVRLGDAPETAKQGVQAVIARRKKDCGDSFRA